uniref:Ig-like domain-containing protein n=1 Tax=Amphimedon queenslandica TaxID=400682 RepID=A0A1X7VGJ7_AMPQE
NGRDITNSSCLTAYPTSSSSELRVELQSQECDGFFSCGLGGILSVSTEFHACPVKNVTGVTTVEIEEGSSALLTCNFFPSPIKNYTTTWFIGTGSNTMEIQDSTTEHLQSYLLQKPDQPNSYFCKIWIQSSTNSRCQGSLSVSSFVIKVQLKEKYEMPTITQDLNYTMNNNGDGGVFTVTSHGTNLMHNWYKNDRLINNTGNGILEISNTSLRVKEVNGSLRIAYVVSNVDYDNTSHSMRQTFGEIQWKS